MGDTYLVIDYDRTDIPSSSPQEFGMKVSVDVLKTYSPYPEVDDGECLVIQQGDESVPEQIMRVANKLELTSLDLLPADTLLTQFTSASFPGGLAGKTVVVSYPAAWSYFFGGGPSITVVIQGDGVTTDIPFPGFGNNLIFTVDEDTYTDGVANRDYTGVSGTEYRAITGYGVWTDVPSADNRYKSVQSYAQSLVDELNQDSFVGTSEEHYS